MNLERLFPIERNKRIKVKGLKIFPSKIILFERTLFTG